jgi:4-diphosphocytidyl-2-C-methyl-D-erythritol kinase
VQPARAEGAPAKINLTLRVLGRRPDGYHDIESLVVFAAVGDTLSFEPADALSLTVCGPTAAAAGALDDNLVLRAVRALGERVEGLMVGRFTLTKRLPVAAGLGGGSADAAAALRLVAHANAIALDDTRLVQAARVTGADVPVCVDPRPRVMRGIGEVLSAPLDLPNLPAVLVNPGVAVPTKDVFAALHREPDTRSASMPPLDVDALGDIGRPKLVEALAADRNDLEAPAIAIAPVIADVLRAMSELDGCCLARMSGSGATCFALFDTAKAATAAAAKLQSAHLAWWVQATTLGSRLFPSD